LQIIITTIMFRSLRSITTRVRTPSSKSFCTSRPEPQVAESLLQIGTRRIFDHDHDMYRELCRNFYKEKVTPFEKDWEADGHVSREVWKQAGETGMLGVTVPEEYGGLGLDAKYAAVNWEEQSYALNSGCGFSLHSEIVCPYLVHYGECVEGLL
jgi:long-chain-acyl-CoA dehydrogenase